MKRLKLTVEPKGPIVLGSGMDIQNVRESRDFIAGSVIRGALAQVILTRLKLHKTDWQNGDQPPRSDLPAEFKLVFSGPSGAHFGYLYPAGAGAASLPSPATAYECKTFGVKHPIADVLRSAIRTLPPVRQCKSKTCQRRLERLRGFASWQSGRYAVRDKVPHRPLIRVGLNRWTEAADDQILYVLDAIVPSSRLSDQPIAFTGFSTMSDEQWAALKELLDAHFLPDGDGYHLRVGSARSRGMGEARLSFSESPVEKLDAKLDQFQSDLPETDRFLYFSLTARAPVSVCDESGSATFDLTPEVLRRCAGGAPAGLEAVVSFVEAEQLSGWSQAWGMPKPVAPVIAAGSVFAYRAPIGERDSILAFLRDIETNGFGQRRAEGLGELVACEPFHLIHEA